jgi:putative flippase GtrA
MIRSINATLERVGKAGKADAVSTRSQIAKYFVLGGFNFFLTLGVFSGLLHVIGVNYVLSLIGSWFVGMLFMYVTNFIWVFSDNGALRFDERFLRFLSVGVTSITMNSAVLSAIVETWETDPFWTQIALTPFVVMFNFSATKYFALKLRARRR